MTQPKILDNNELQLSIIMVTYNAEEVVDKTLLSIFGQTFNNYELIVIDGSSIDKTVQYLEKYLERFAYFISEPDSGIYDAMNKGLRVAKGDYVQFLNAGDYFVNDSVLDVCFGEDYGNPHVIYGDIIVLHEDGKTHYQKAKPFTYEQLIKVGSSVLCHQAMFVRRNIVPLYSTEYKFKGELNWYFDICDHLGDKLIFKYINIAIAYYALGGFGHQHFLKNRIEWLKVVKNRYGVGTIIENNLFVYIYKNSFYRYPKLEKYHNAFVKIFNCFKGR
jgi:glycosyltransferase involved in cell wall biosynthesis